MREHVVISKEKLVGLDDKECLELAISALIGEFKETIPEVRADDLFCHFRYLTNGDLHIRGTYLGEKGGQNDNY